ncbi:hypothetical protein SD77_4202 [Bacillus badius]|uniref:Uncharacterized protein n=1 Tax=Bacillus badius TaxID=1455 RepID=A0ABR5AUT4_BACBA|nr:hypothetical protein SD77_4202 [Bacillus badius]
MSFLYFRSPSLSFLSLLPLQENVLKKQKREWLFLLPLPKKTFFLYFIPYIMLIAYNNK